jgi:hypothetical protein
MVERKVANAGARIILTLAKAWIDIRHYKDTEGALLSKIRQVSDSDSEMAQY